MVNMVGRDSTEESEIVKFYENSSVFITGGTGFVGKCLIEKLLRSCPNINHIYLLLRPKRGTAASDRLDHLLKSFVFDSLKKSRPGVFDKIIPVPGDITSANLGISEANKKILQDNVSVVFHCAATVKFDEDMRISADINIGGVHRILELSRGMRKINAICHVSTAYSNCDRKEIKEVVYPPPLCPFVAMKSFASLGDTIVNQITPLLIGDKPNTYTFTKSLAENLVLMEKKDLPVCIVRPSIVTGTMKEPIEGWVDNLNGGSGALLAHGKGFLGKVYANEDIVLDWIPVDHLVNLIISAAWELGTKKTNELVVYNCCTGQLNPVTQKDVSKFAVEAFFKTPFSQLLKIPSLDCTSFMWLSKFHTFFAVYVPCVALDFVTAIIGGKPMMLKHYEKVQNSCKALTYFRTKDWQFSTENMVALYSKMSSVDQNLFNFKVQDINWRLYIHNYVLGLRRYVLKENDSTLPAARRSLKRLRCVFSWMKILSFLILLFNSVKMIRLFKKRLQLFTKRL